MATTPVILSPRDYQKELLEAAKKKNIIACLGTGTGKTLIAVMLIQELSDQIKVPYSEGGKRTVFLVPQIALVYQQASLIERQAGLKVGRYCGDQGACSWSKDVWEEEFSHHHVLVMTAEIFRVILKYELVQLSRINLLVVDECHRSVGDHPYNSIMTYVRSYPAALRPKILGLSAALVNSKCTPTTLMHHIRLLERRMLSSIKTSWDLETVSQFGTKPKEAIILYKSGGNHHSDYEDVIISYLNNTLAFLDSVPDEVWDSGVVIKERQVKKYVSYIREAFISLGPWCSSECAKVLRREVEDALFNARNETPILLHLLHLTKTAIEFTSYMCNKLMNEVECDNKAVFFAKPRLLKLLQLLKLYQNSKLLCGIIFVEKRVIATLVYLWLVELKESCPELNYLSPCIIVGHGAGGSSYLALHMGVRKQERILQGFRLGRYNVLVSTSVVEEGLDVPTCNLVIRFDLPTTFRAYIQSKGRARAAKALFALLVEAKHWEKFKWDIEDYREIEKIIYQRCIEQEMFKEDIGEDYENENDDLSGMFEKEDEQENEDNLSFSEEEDGCEQ